MSKKHQFKIYAYTTRTYKEKRWYKIGQSEKDVRKRVEQQDGTSNPEKLILGWQSDLTSKTDHEFREFLTTKGCTETRIDKKREWMQFPEGVDFLDFIQTCWNEFEHQVERPNSFKMRDSQDKCVKKVVDSFRNKQREKFLISAVMRFGKTFTCYEIMRTLESENVLILTGKPEVRDSWRGELEGHINYEGYNFVDLRNLRVPLVKLRGKNVYFCSFQYLEASSSFDKQWIYNIPFDLLIIDEEHHGTKTDLSVEILNKLPKCREIHISGTPYKSMPLFDEESTFSYSYSDRVEEDPDCPRMKIYAMSVLEEIIVQHNDAGFTGGDSFNLSKFFETDNEGRFLHHGYVERLMTKVFDPADLMNRSASTQCPFHIEGIDYSSLNHILIRMPSVASSRALCDMLKYLLGPQPEYRILLAAGQGRGTITKVEEVKRGIRSSKKTITVTCGRFETGVSIPEWSSIFLFDSGHSPESYWQFVHRASTNSKGKNNFYVFDFNPTRALLVSTDTAILDKKQGQKTISALGNHYKVAPLLVQKGTGFVPIEAEEALEFYIKQGSKMSSRFASERGIGENIYDKSVIDILSSLSGTFLSSRIAQIIADNEGLEEGKCRERIKQKLTPKEKKDESNKIREKLKNVASRIPVAIISSGASDLESLFRGDDKVFQYVTGISLSDYRFLLDSGAFDIDWHRRCAIQVSSLFQSLDSSSKMLWDILELFQNTVEASPGTPRHLAESMLDSLPGEIFEDPSKTFCDPSSSTGTFIFLLIDRLMKSQENVIPDPEQRLQNILGNQIFVFEKDYAPFVFFEKIFKKMYNVDKSKIKINLHNEDLLNKESGMEFDVVVMNPPYQDAPKSKKNRGAATGNTLWNKFVEKSLKDSWIKPKGFLCAVHPSGWRRPSGKKSRYVNLFPLMTGENSMKYLEMHDLKSGKKTFGAGTRYDWYLIQKTPSNSKSKTTIIDEDGNKTFVDLTKKQWLPNGEIEVIENLLGEGTEVEFSNSAYEPRRPHMSKTKTEKFCYPVIHSIPKTGPRIFYSSVNDRGHFGVPKVIVGDSVTVNEVIIDMEGKFGMTQHAIGLRVESYEDALLAKKYLESEKFKKILKACSWSNFQIDHRMFGDFKKGFWNE